MLQEKQLCGPSEAAEPISRKLIRELAAYIEDAILSSQRFQAFADSADVQRARIPRAEDGLYNRHLIEETVRQRQNGMPGYKSEYEYIQKQILAYRHALERRFSNSAHIDHIISQNLMEIKDNHIHNVSRQLRTARSK